MKNSEFDKYLSSGFEKANQRESQRYSEELELNYAEFLPLDKEAGILDIGCGMGQFIAYLRKNGYRSVSGIDVGQEAVDYCRKKGIDNVLKIDSLADFLSKNIEKFDLIILKSVIAHLPRRELISILSAARSSLKHGGRLVVETFNASVWTGVFMRYNDFTHRNAFTENSLRQVLLLAGFTEIEISPNRYLIKKPSQIIAFLVRKIWQMVLSYIYIAERGTGSNPHILSKLLIAVAEK
ncbi:MAG: class I SAM-dependent methyltransferase [Candidatus Omnitrophota bacterium]|nr:class I SAM-dependent methyltransferase [Candidatus Omnitrophota bacterium]